MIIERRVGEARTHWGSSGGLLKGVEHTADTADQLAS